MKKWSRRHSSAIVIISIFVALFWLFFVAKRSPEHVGTAEIMVNDSKYIFKLWHAKPLIPLPFFDTPVAYFEFDDQRLKLHSGAFGYSRGDLIVSPDKTRIAVCRRFEGGEKVAYYIELKTRNIHPLSSLEYTDDFDQNGWQRYEWTMLRGR